MIVSLFSLNFSELSHDYGSGLAVSAGRAGWQEGENFLIFLCFSTCQSGFGVI